MHILTIPDTPAVAAKQNVKPGSFVCLDVNAWELALAHQALLPTVAPYSPPLHAVNDRTLIIFAMGFGDAIMLIPVLREMKLRHPEGQIHLACHEWTRQVFFNLPYVDGFVSYPVNHDLLQDFGIILTLEHSVEFNLMAHTMHMTDRFAQHLGLCREGETWTDHKKPEIALSGEEKAWAKANFPKTPGKRRLGFQVQAGVRCRSYPVSKLTMPRDSKVNGKQPPLFAEMIRDGWEIALLGTPGEFRVDATLPNGMIDMTRMGLTFRQSIAFLTTCDAFLGPDSSLLHVCGTLDIPAVGLFGPYPWKLRTAYYQSVHALTGQGACPKAPCFHSYHSGLPVFPEDGPCAKTGVCEELAAITPERIRAKLEQLAARPGNTAGP